MIRSPEEITEQAVMEHDELTDQINELPHGALFRKVLDRLYPDWYQETQDAFVAEREPDICGELADRAEYIYHMER